MRRRDLLKGGASAIAASIAGSASAQELTVNPKILEIVRANWCFGKPRLRRNIYWLYESDPDHPIIKAYRHGVSVMRGRPESDPTSWLYQANIHGTDAPSPWPTGAPWATCEHEFHFLSWHRMYLYFFERILRAASSYPDFAMPYWDYEPVSRRKIPLPFRSPDNAGNALWDSSRPDMNSGNVLPDSAVNSSDCLMPLSFLGGFQEAVEDTPHDVVHSSIGGNMGSFDTAGRDPIFWLHHCNIDRLWEKWLEKGAGRVNPTADATWMNTNFTFVDENRNFVQMTGADVNYTINQLDYQYDNPRTCVPPWWSYLLMAAKVVPVNTSRRVLTSFLLGRNIRPTPDQERILIQAEEGETRDRLASMLSPDQFARSVENSARYFLTFEGVQTQAPLKGYFEIYVGLPSDSKPDPGGPYYVGNLSLFGADAKSRRSARGNHIGHSDFGLKRTLDLTIALKRLVDRGDLRKGWNITLVPAGVKKSADQRFVFNADANPRIESILLTIEKED